MPTARDLVSIDTAIFEWDIIDREQRSKYCRCGKAVARLTNVVSPIESNEALHSRRLMQHTCGPVLNSACVDEGLHFACVRNQRSCGHEGNFVFVLGEDWLS